MEISSFRWISVTLSLILGFGVSRLLSSMVAMFRSRTKAQLDWIPLAWAGCVFFWQVQYWWAVIELPRLIEVWHIGEFMILLGLALLLFLTAALILPSDELDEGEMLTETFERDGHWALPCLSLYFLAAFVADWHFWGIYPLSFEGAMLAWLAVLPLAVFIPIRVVKIAVTVIFVILSTWAGWELSPKSY